MVDDKHIEVKRRRLPALDLLRGFFLFAIILDHSPFLPRFTDLVTGGGVLLSSAAEGFFIISGLLIGYLYSHKILTNTRSVIVKLWQRAFLLYAISISTTLLFTLLAGVLFDPTQGNLYSNPLLSLGFAQELLSLNYTYGWADFLSRYAVFMITSPLALLLIALGKTWILLLSSSLLWFVSPVIGLEQFTAWQILFVFGIAFGSHLDQVTSYFKKRKSRMLLLDMPVLIFAITALWSLYVKFLYPGFFIDVIGSISSSVSTVNDSLLSSYRAIETLFDKERMGIGRVIISFIWFIALYILFTKYERVIYRVTGGYLKFLGQNSLTVYVIHAFVIFFTTLIVLSSQIISGVMINTIYALLVLGVVSLLTYVYIKIQNSRSIFTLLRWLWKNIVGIQ